MNNHNTANSMLNQIARAVEVQQPESEIDAQINTLYTNLDELQYCITTLAEKLNPCLIVIPDTPNANGVARDSSCSSPLGQSIEGVNERTLSLIRALRILRERVAL